MGCASKSSVALPANGADIDDEEAEARFHGFDCARLLAAAPHLRRLAFYVCDEVEYMRLRPAVQGSLDSLQSHAAHLEELALWVFSTAPSPPSFPRLHTLHASFDNCNNYPGEQLHPVFPALRVLTLGTAWGGYDGVVVWEEVASLTTLERLCVVGGPPDCRLQLEGRLDALSACGALQHLRLCSVTGVSFAELMELSRAPQLRNVVLEGCTFDKDLKPDVLEVALKARAGRDRGLVVAARATHPLQVPCLLDADAFESHWRYVQVPSCCC
jgi:hypothetical protein